MRRLLLGVIALIVVAVAAIAGMLAFGTAAPPPVLASIDSPFRSVDFRDLAPIEYVPSRDGSRIAYRVYRAAAGQPDRVAIAIHGSSGSGTSLHPLAKALHADGITVYVPDIRGHGQTGRHGDIDRDSQLDDDFADLTAMIRARHPGAPLTLVGFSSGGGFALHLAGSSQGQSLTRLVLLSPMLGREAPTVRPANGSWARPSIPRIIALIALNRVGVHAFDYLPVLSFAIAPENRAVLTGEYSFRLLRAFGTNDYAADLRNTRPPVAVVAGANDELFDAALFAPTVTAVRSDASVTVVPGLGHIGLTVDPAAVPAILAAMRG